MKLFRIAALLAPLALALPLSAHAAKMDAQTKTDYDAICATTATQNNPGMNAAEVKAHCDCGQQQIEAKFSDAEIKSLSDKTTPPSAEMTSRLQQAVAEKCLNGKK